MACKDCTADRGPFYVGNNPRFPYARNGYLPSLCDDCYYKTREPERVVIERHTDLKPVYAQIQDLKAKLMQQKQTFNKERPDYK